jgi:hypothetical protein
VIQGSDLPGPRDRMGATNPAMRGYDHRCAGVSDTVLMTTAVREIAEWPVGAWGDEREDIHIV